MPATTKCARPEIHHAALAQLPYRGLDLACPCWRPPLARQTNEICRASTQLSSPFIYPPVAVSPSESHSFPPDGTSE